MRPKREVLVDGPHEGLLAQLAQRLGEVVRHEAEVVREQALLELRRLPPGR